MEYISRDALNGVDFSQTLFLYAHDYNKPLARADSGTLKTSIDENGLKFTANMPNKTLVNDIRADINAGNIKGCSFGFTIADGGDRWDTADDGTTIHYVDQINTVDELTITPIPAYTQTSVQVQRDLRAYEQTIKEEKATMGKQDNEEKRASSAASTASVASSTSAASSATSTSTSSASSSASLDEIVSRAVSQAVTSAVQAIRNCGDDTDDQKRDDDVDNTDVDTSVDDSNDADEIEDDTNSNSASPASTASATSAASSASSSASSAATSSAASSAASSTTSATNSQNSSKKENVRMIDITPKNHETREKQLVNEFAEYLRSHNVGENLRDTSAGVGLSYGQVLIPKTFLAPEHEQHQFPRLEQYVKTVTAPTTTGQWSYFEENNDVLETKAEFDHAKQGTPANIKTIVWNLQTYAKKYPISKELISDSKAGVTPNWVSEIQNQIKQLQDNTNDKLIAGKFTGAGVNTITATDAIADMKTVLNVKLKPFDSQASQIILSQSAYNALDQLKDNFGRPLLQPDPTSATSHQLFGKTVIIIPDELLGKAGEANAVIAPLGKAIIDFQNDQVTGQFLDNFDIFENILGIYVRKDVEAVRPDLINFIKLPDKALAASSNTAVTTK